MLSMHCFVLAVLHVFCVRFYFLVNKMWRRQNNLENEMELDSDDSDPFAESDDEDEDYNAESDSSTDYYSSEEYDFLDQNVREQIAVESEMLYLSKDKRIRYSTEPPSRSGRTSAASVLHSQPGEISDK